MNLLKPLNPLNPLNLLNLLNLLKLCNLHASRAYLTRGQSVDFHEVYERHAAAVLRFASGLTGNRAMAQDLTSETFVRLWTAGGAIRVETVRAYLFTIVRNLYRSDLRRSWRAAPLDEEMPDPIDRVAAPVERKSTVAAAMRALRQLPVEDREALLMRAGDVSYEDIARALGISIGAAKVRVHRSRAKLIRLRDMEGNHGSDAKRGSGSTASVSLGGSER